MYEQVYLTFSDTLLEADRTLELIVGRIIINQLISSLLIETNSLLHLRTGLKDQPGAAFSFGSVFKALHYFRSYMLPSVFFIYPQSFDLDSISRIHLKSAASHGDTVCFRYKYIRNAR